MGENRETTSQTGRAQLGVGGQTDSELKKKKKKSPRDRTDETVWIAALSMIIGHWWKEAGNCWVAQEGSVKPPLRSIIITTYLLRDPTDVPAGTGARSASFDFVFSSRRLFSSVAFRSIYSLPAEQASNSLRLRVWLQAEWVALVDVHSSKLSPDLSREQSDNIISLFQCCFVLF